MQTSGLVPMTYILGPMSQKKVTLLNGSQILGGGRCVLYAVGRVSRYHDQKSDT